jgi:hypothetical protein
LDWLSGAYIFARCFLGQGIYQVGTKANEPR